MFTQVKTPQEVFFSPQRLLVPLFQRPYVWSLDRQWRPLWDDVRRVAESILTKGTSAPHFLGAVVLQQQPNEIGTLSVRTVIDGQQRLTTLQILLDAVHGQVSVLGFDGLARQAQDLVENQDQYTKAPEDKFKVWPTNRDRPAFNDVMSATPPVHYSSLAHYESRLVRAHEFFSNEIRKWLNEGASDARANALVTTVSRYLQVVVIDLQADEDAQEIFETLNARGTPLTAADLIKNFVFQRLDVPPAQAEMAYREYWEVFETPFWELEIATGRMLYSRSSLFLTQWLIAQTREDITAREVFSRFKRYVTDSEDPVGELLPKLRRAADVYANFTQGAARQTGALSRLELFVYRISTLDSEVIKPLLIWLCDSDLPPIPKDQLDMALDSLESWFVRRTIVKASTKYYNKLIVDLLVELNRGERANVGIAVRAFLANQSSDYTYWPSDADVRNEIIGRPIYKRLVRSRLRMIIEALEDKRRGFNATTGGKFTESSVPRSVTSIEHVMPQEWRTSWPGPEFDESGLDRDILIHTLGNLTLVTQGLNSKVSNSPWETKRSAFMEHATLLLTADIVNSSSASWGSQMIHERTETLTRELLQIWPVPEGNVGRLEASDKQTSVRITVSDLVQAGFLKPGQVLFARVQAHRGREAYISEDGGIFVDGVRDETPSGAAKKVSKSVAEDGWWFWLVNLESGVSLADIRNDYLQSIAEDGDSDDDSGG